MVWGFAFASIAGRVTDHERSLLALVLAWLLLKETVMFSPGLAHPHMRIGLLRWMTMLDWKRLWVQRSLPMAGTSMTSSLGIWALVCVVVNAVMLMSSAYTANLSGEFGVFIFNLSW